MKDTRRQPLGPALLLSEATLFVSPIHLGFGTRFHNLRE